jgi:hypothetical protein
MPNTALAARALTARTGQFHRIANGACPEARATRNLRAPPALQFALAPPPWSSRPSPPEVQITPGQLPTCCLHPQSQLRSPYNSKPLPDRIHWCTGEDSNLRSSQGAADLQSAAINRSATCAHPAGTPTRHFPLPAHPRHSNQCHRRFAVFAHCGMRELANALTTPGGTLWDGNAEKTSETLRLRPQFFSFKLRVLQGYRLPETGAGEGT